MHDLPPATVAVRLAGVFSICAGLLRNGGATNHAYQRAPIAGQNHVASQGASGVENITLIR